MASDFETLVLRLEANATKFEKGIEKARRDFDKHAKAIEERSKALEARVNASLDSAGKTSTSAAAGLAKFGAAAFAAVGGLSAISDEIKRLADIDDASQKIGVTSDTLQALQFAATQSASSAEEITEALRKFSLEAAQTNQKTSELRQLFEANGVAYRDAAGNLLPMTVLLERFGALVANARDPMEAIQIATIGFGKAGGNLVPVLTQIGGGMRGIEQAARDARVVIDKEIIEAAGRFDDAWTGAILRAKAEVANFTGEIIKLASEINELLKTLGVFNPLAIPQAGVRALTAPSGNDRISAAFSAFPAGGAASAAPKGPATVIPKFGAASGGGGGKTADDFAKETARINDKIVALNIEAKTVALGTAAQERAKIVMDLENAARDAGIKLTEKQTAQIQTLATRYADAAVAAEAAKKAQQDLVKSADEFRSTASSALSGFINDIRAGKSAAEAFARVLDNLAGKLVDVLTSQAITALLGPTGTALGGSAGGGIAAIFAAFAGRAGGGAVNRNQPYRVGESGPEIFVPQQAGRILRGGQGMGGVSISMSFDARGAGPNEVQALRAEIEKQNRELPNIIRRSVSNDRLRGRG